MKTNETKVEVKRANDGTRFKTARATVSCAEFQAGDIVAVQFFYHDAGGQPWYLINRSQHGELRNPVAYPEKNLTNFVL